MGQEKRKLNGPDKRAFAHADLEPNASYFYLCRSFADEDLWELATESESSNTAEVEDLGSTDNSANHHDSQIMRVIKSLESAGIPPHLLSAVQTELKASKEVGWSRSEGSYSVDGLASEEHMTNLLLAAVSARSEIDDFKVVAEALNDLGIWNRVQNSESFKELQVN